MTLLLPTLHSLGGVHELANKGKVISPKQWFGTDGYTKDHDTKDVLPNEWTRI